MLKKNTLIFIQNILLATLGLDLHLFNPPFDEISQVDRSLRYSFSEDSSYYHPLKNIFTTLEPYTFVFYEDEFALHYVFFKPFPQEDAVISVGPYSTLPIDETFFNKIIETTSLDFTALEWMKSFLYAIPWVENNLTLLSALDAMITYILPDHPHFESIYKKFNRPHSFLDGFDQLGESFEFSIGTIEERYAQENRLLHHVSKGDTQNALIELKNFIQSIPTHRCQDSLRDEKNLMYTGNSLFRKAAEHAKVHPVYLHQLSTLNAKRIEQLTSSKQTHAHMEEMVKSYCTLVKEYAFGNYTPLIQSVIHYINIHLSTFLSLSLLAQHFNVSGPHLSSLFKKEVGVTITHFINKQRIDTSRKLLETTSMDIHMIGSFVGIHDSNYFTKLFKQYIQCTPSEYRAQLKS